MVCNTRLNERWLPWSHGYRLVAGCRCQPDDPARGGAPAGATTLYVRLRVTIAPFYLLIIEIAFDLPLLQGIVNNRPQLGGDFISKFSGFDRSRLECRRLDGRFCHFLVHRSPTR